MEKIRISDNEFNIVSIAKSGANLLTIELAEEYDLSSLDKSSIEVYTEGGVKCAILTGYTAIYRVYGNTVTLSNDGSVYKVSAYLLDEDGYIIENVYITEDEITEFTITEPIQAFYWKAKWNFESKQWEEGGAEPEPTEPTTPQPTTEERIMQLVNKIAEMELAVMYLSLE